jgi:hypothetical protein
MLSLNSKHVQYVKIYLPGKFEVNLITHLGIILMKKRAITPRWLIRITSKLQGR